MDFIYLALGLNILLIFLVNRDWLVEKQPFTILLFVNVSLFLLGYLLPYFSIVHSVMVVFLKVPVLSQLLFLLLLKVFKKIQKTPAGPFWTIDAQLMKGLLFNVSFWIVAIVFPAALAFLDVI